VIYEFDVLSAAKTVDLILNNRGVSPALVGKRVLICHCVKWHRNLQNILHLRAVYETGVHLNLHLCVDDCQILCNGLSVSVWSCEIQVQNRTFQVIVNVLNLSGNRDRRSSLNLVKLKVCVCELNEVDLIESGN